jgi:hypothetical protein
MIDQACRPSSQNFSVVFHRGETSRAPTMKIDEGGEGEFLGCCSLVRLRYTIP